MGIDRDVFLKGKVENVLLKFAIPSIMTLLVTELYNMVDTFFVGRHVGPDAIGALTIAFPIQRLIAATGLCIAVGAAANVARYLGEKQHKKLRAVLTNAITLTTIVMVIMSIFLYIFLDEVLISLGASRVILPLARQYVSIILLGGLFQCLTFVMCYNMNSLGNPKITLIATSLGAILNIIIDTIFVVKLNFGIKGAAYATTISQITAFLFALYVFISVAKDINLSFEIGLDKDVVKTVVAVGFPTFIVEVSDAVVALVLNNLLLRHGGDAAVIVSGTITKISMFMYVNIIGISSGMQPIAACNFGAKNFKRLKETIKKTIAITLATSIAIWLVMMIFTEPIIGSFLKDDALLKDATKAYRIMICIFPAISLYYVAIYSYQAVGKAKESFLLSIYRQIVIFIPVVIIFMKLWKVMGAWYAYPASDVISAITGLVYIKKVKESLEEKVEQMRYKNLAIRKKKMAALSENY